MDHVDGSLGVVEELAIDYLSLKIELTIEQLFYIILVRAFHQEEQILSVLWARNKTKSENWKWL